MSKNQLIVNTNFAKTVTLSECLKFLTDNGIHDIELTTDGRAHAYRTVIRTKDFTHMDEFQHLKKVLDQYKVNVRALSGGWADFNTGDTEHVERQCTVARWLGADIIRFFASNPHKDCPSDDHTRERIFGNLSGFMNDPICLENHGGLFSDLGQVARLGWMLSAPQGLVFDPANYVVDGVDPFKALLMTHQAIRHVHVKDVTADGKFCAVGEGVVPWKDILAGLEKQEYRGMFSVEYESEEDYEGKKKGLLRSIKNFKELIK